MKIIVARNPAYLAEISELSGRNKIIRRNEEIEQAYELIASQIANASENATALHQTINNSEFDFNGLSAQELGFNTTEEYQTAVRAFLIQRATVLFEEKQRAQRNREIINTAPPKWNWDLFTEQLGALHVKSMGQPDESASSLSSTSSGSTHSSMPSLGSNRPDAESESGVAIPVKVKNRELETNNAFKPNYNQPSDLIPRSDGTDIEPWELPLDREKIGKGLALVGKASLVAMGALLAWAAMLALGLLLIVSGVGIYRTLREQLVSKYELNSSLNVVNDSTFGMFMLPVSTTVLTVLAIVDYLVIKPFDFFTAPDKTQFLKEFVFGKEVPPAPKMGSFYKHTAMGTAALMGLGFLGLGVLALGSVLIASGVGAPFGIGLLAVAGQAIFGAGTTSAIGITLMAPIAAVATSAFIVAPGTMIRKGKESFEVLAPTPVVSSVGSSPVVSQVVGSPANSKDVVGAGMFNSPGLFRYFSRTPTPLTTPLLSMKRDGVPSSRAKL